MPLSPMMQQYKEIKREHEDCLLFYRLGDFYELFFDDAHIASRELELTLTGRNCGLEERAPMCGVPFHAADAYIAKLVEKGYKVAICEQTEVPSQAKGIVERAVIRIVTPGTLDISGATDGNENLYTASIYIEGGRAAAAAYADITTGELFAVEFDCSRGGDELISVISGIDPKEIVVSEAEDKIISELRESFPDIFLNTVDASYFKYSSCQKTLLSQFDMSSLVPLGLDDRAEITIATGALLMYLIEVQRQTPEQIKELVIKESDGQMRLDRSTMKNLELLETLYDHRTKGSLLGVIDKTKTAMGARLLKRFIKEPLNDSREVNRRLDAVAALSGELAVRNDIVRGLREVYDFERLSARVASMRANGKDLVALRSTLKALPGIREQLAHFDTELLREISEKIGDFDELYMLIDEAIVDEPPFTVSEGGLIRAGYSEELDGLKESIKDAKEWIANLEEYERQRTGIKTVKVGFNKVFGYYIDVSRACSNDVPDNYIRKQTLVNNERFITPELKEKENLVLSAEARINALEHELFKAVRTAVAPHIAGLQRASQAVALLDVMNSFAEVSSMYGYCKPEVDDSYVIDIRKGRHPAVEQLIGEGMFVSNDSVIDRDGLSLLIITGPNMSGKSTYMRQTAIIVLMAQIGCFVPAESARIGIVDRVFTRIGASDNLAYGQSTFFIEMSELANILRNASDRSLIILDEIGRGTSTFDGLSIAWATIEYLSKPEAKVRTMFATHYHELTVLEDRFSSVRNLSVDVAESGNDVVFLHRIVEGAANKSYGIHVAKIAGVPREIRRNADAKLRELEAGSGKEASTQISFFDAGEMKLSSGSAYDELIDEIKALNVNAMTPIEALIKLKDIQDSIDD